MKVMEYSALSHQNVMNPLSEISIHTRIAHGNLLHLTCKYLIKID